MLFLNTDYTDCTDGHGEFADAEEGELYGGDALIEAAVLSGTGEERPLREEKRKKEE